MRRYGNVDKLWEDHENKMKRIFWNVIEWWSSMELTMKKKHRIRWSTSGGIEGVEKLEYST